MPSVAIFGGGVGGLTTTHELAERGFDVEVFDVRPDLWGGVARSHNKIRIGDVRDAADPAGRAWLSILPRLL